MTKTPDLNDAIILATNCHRGQSDKVGAPYILHPLRVMGFLGHSATEAERIVAVLHDVIEDCDVSPAQLRESGYSEEIIQALQGVTKTPEKENDYEAFIRRGAKNPISRRVKLADLQDNMDTSRIGEITPKDEARLEKYRRAKQFLETFSG